MKKISFTLATAGMFVLGTTSASAAMLQDGAEASKGFTQVLKEQFIQGGPAFMGIVLLCLILGLAVAIERIIYLEPGKHQFSQTEAASRRCFGFWWC